MTIKAIQLECLFQLKNGKTLKEKYTDLQSEEVHNNIELTSWQKEIIDQRLEDYYNNPNDVVDFDTTIANIREKI